ncbi:dienelactone hydrolase family protein [Asticcacaulis sp. BYS171W]|uniref:Dienelactone hydrolase family protein n=1 Tax=Asticcacaulis aquaticus TaxID=2984212 RepID=A0ABT5HSE9_9CAUL|nr:dienelactone hydrolase family protein [Asticcacaulis aquaticus]MDC7682996.1 dienelactone hydrolase family protein [Asticcacaulis aquaticus]
MLETTAARWARLDACTEHFGPADTTPRPAMLLFHGCGGIRPHIYTYAKAAAETGIRVFVVDSLKVRGWGRMQGVTLVCTGAALQGYERSGDVLAALWGVSQRPDVISDQIMLAGFSHGGWSIMDLMTQSLTKRGEARLADPDAKLIKKIKGIFMVYPYINFPARSVKHPWLYTIPTTVVLAMRDHLTPYKRSLEVFERLSEQGVPMHTLSLDASHAFDEQGNKGAVMDFDPEAMKASMEAMTAFIEEVLVPAVSVA